MRYFLILLSCLWCLAACQKPQTPKVPFANTDITGLVPAFDPSFLGLWGDQPTIDKVAKDFKIFAQKVLAKDGKSYTIDHTAGSYVYDDQGRIRLFVRHGQSSDGLLKDLKRLLTNSAT